MAPFSVETSSLGSPWLFHWALVASSTSRLTGLAASDLGMAFLARKGTNSSCTSISRKPLLKGPV